MRAEFGLELTSEWANIPLELRSPLEESVARVEGDKLLGSNVLGAGAQRRGGRCGVGVGQTLASISYHHFRLTLVAIKPTPCIGDGPATDRATARPGCLVRNNASHCSHLGMVR